VARSFAVPRQTARRANGRPGHTGVVGGLFRAVRIGDEQANLNVGEFSSRFAGRFKPIFQDARPDCLFAALKPEKPGTFP
jgi:hypothetical protein